VVALTGT